MQKFILPNTGIDTSLINVVVKGTQQFYYKQLNIRPQDSLLDINGTSKVYLFTRN